MIPKTAIFYWDQGEDAMPPERRLAVETFERHNPDWKVEIHSNRGYPGEIPQHRADYFRYAWLAHKGGVYFDTDIVFLRPFPEHLLDGDALLPLDPRLRFHNIAVLGAVPGSRLFDEVADAARVRVASPAYDSGHYQTLGVCLLNRLFWKEAGLMEQPSGEFDVNEIARRLGERFDIRVVVAGPRLVVPVPDSEIERMFRYARNGKWPFTEHVEESIGIHWFGAHHMAGKFIDDMRSDERRTKLGRFLEQQGV